VSRKLGTTASVAALFVGLSLSAEAAEQNRTIFNTPDVKQDRALWTSPAYYLNNTVGQINGMALDVDTYEGATGQPAGARHWGTPGTARAGAVNYASPYRFASAKEHYETWLREANGGTKHTRATIPDWSGRWEGGGGFGGGQGPPSDIVKLLNADYQEAYVQELKANSEGRMWWPSAYCLPSGFFSSLGAQEFLVTPERVWTLAAGNGSNSIRWIYTDGSGHSPEELRFPKWHGESIGFWNGDVLTVYTNQIRPWKGGVSEHSEQLETVERYRRVGDRIEGELTIYDPVVLVRPLTSRMNFTLNRETNPALRPLAASCTDTNGPSPKVYMDDKGLLNERLSGEGGYEWDVADQRPWVTWFNESDKRYKAYLAAGGKPHGVD
jgi:hypothetical protein